MRFFVRFLLLAAGFSLFTFGLLQWSKDGFTLSGLLPFTENYRTQGLHYLMLGLAMIPPSLWEIFNLERLAQAPAESSDTLLEPPSETGAQDQGLAEND